MTIGRDRFLGYFSWYFFIVVNYKKKVVWSNLQNNHTTISNGRAFYSLEYAVHLEPFYEAVTSGYFFENTCCRIY
jgi:hypothetical protein